MYSIFSEAVTGASTARALGLADHLQKRMSDAVHVHLSARATSNALDQWLALRLQLASAAVVGMLAFLAVVSQAFTGLGEIRPSPTGIAPAGYTKPSPDGQSPIRGLPLDVVAFGACLA